MRSPLLTIAAAAATSVPCQSSLRFEDRADDAEEEEDDDDENDDDDDDEEESEENDEDELDEIGAPLHRMKRAPSPWRDISKTSATVGMLAVRNPQSLAPGSAGLEVFSKDVLIVWKTAELLST